MTKEKENFRRNVWKLYGDDPAGFLASHNNKPTTQAIRDGNYISAVRDATIDVHTGEILVIMGLSGSGKSTLVRCMSKLIDPTGGEIDFDGTDLLRASNDELIEIRRHKMGMVFQNFALLPHRNVIQNIAFPLEVQGIDKEEREAKAREIIELVGLEGRDKYFPRELSVASSSVLALPGRLRLNLMYGFSTSHFRHLIP